MSRRFLAGFIATIFAIIAALLVYLYTAGADERAMSDMSPREVFVVAEEIPAGTPAEALQDYLVIQEVPETAIVPGGVQALGDLQGQVTTTALKPGEQLLAARFAPPEEIEEEETSFEIPPGHHQLTIALSSVRVLGGHLQAGDTVGLFVSTEELGQTHLVRNKVLVTRVEGAVTTVLDEDGNEVTQPAADTLVVTLAATAPDAEIIVHAAEFHKIWLSLEPADAPEDGTRVVTPEELYE